MKKHPKLLTQINWSLIFILILLASCKVSKPALKDTTPIARSEAIEQDWQSALKSSFRKHYKIVVNSHSKKMHASYPVIIQDLLNMTLIRSNGEKVRFEMDKEAYMTLAHTSHTPLAIYSILYPTEFNINDSTLQKLHEYSLLLKEAKEGIMDVDHINTEQKQRIFSLLNQSDEYIQNVMAVKETNKEQYHDFTKSVRPLVEKNLYEGAKEQLIQYLSQLEKWKTLYPDENWDELRVAVLGFHQPRDLYALKVFFQWLLNEPEVEQKVVYAEFQFPIFGNNRLKAEKLALELLTKVDLEKEASLFLLGEETLLQKDVMGPAAVEILKEWGTTKWFMDQD